MFNQAPSPRQKPPVSALLLPTPERPKPYSPLLVMVREIIRYSVVTESDVRRHRKVQALILHRFLYELKKLLTKPRLP
jgi:hypothetical protein